MFRRYWMCALAVIGLAFSVAAYAGLPSGAQAHSSNAPRSHEGRNSRALSSSLASIQDSIGHIARELEAANASQASAVERQLASRNVADQDTMAASARRMFLVSFFDSFVTVIGVLLIGLTLYYTKRQATATGEALELARRTMEIEHRPWVSAKAELAGPIVFREGCPTIPLKITVKNFGTAPALSVRIDPNIQPMIEEPMIQIRVSLEKLRNARRGDLISGDLYGEILFPGEERSRNINVTLTRDQVVSALRVRMVQLGARLEPFVAGTVGYFSAWHEDPYYTTFNYRIGQRNNRIPDGFGPIDASEGERAASDLVLIPYYFGNNAT